MSKCYHCGKVLSDDWIRKQGASLLGRTGGQAKARSRAQAQAAAHARWKKAREQKKSA